MKRWFTVAVMIFAIGLWFVPAVKAAGLEKPFVVYADKMAKENHYIPSGWMGDYSDITVFDDNSTDNPHSGRSCIKVVYSAKQTQGNGWTGIYWQNPPNNWGSIKGGFDLTGANKLSFWARGETGNEVIDKVKIGGIGQSAPNKDTAIVEIGPIQLTKEWKEYTVNLAGSDLSYISGGFCFVVSSRLNPNGCTFYIDDIQYATDANIKPVAKQAEEIPFPVYSERTAINNHYIPSGWMGDHGDLGINDNCSTIPHSGISCIKITYSAKHSQGAGWAGIYWQDPPNNWGDFPGGYDLSKAKKLTFWARGEKGGERIAEFKVGGIFKRPEYSDTDASRIGPVDLNKDWTKYTIDLEGRTLSKIIGGFCIVFSSTDNPEGAVVYLDDIQYE
jgi:hypothetical protein